MRKSLPLRTFLASAIAALVIERPAAAEEEGPFGFVMGADIGEYSCVPINGNIYQCDPPRRHSAFDTYGVNASPGTGLCRIKALGRDISDNGYGLTLKARTDEIALQIRSVYGAPAELVNLLLPGSIWNELDDWMMAISEGDRRYMHIWKGVGLRGIDQIAVSANAVSSQTGRVDVEFLGENYAACQAAQSAVDSSVF